jgi:hypothetical protein
VSAVCLTLFPEIKTYPPETLPTMAANHDAQFKALLKLKAARRDFSKQFVFLRGLRGLCGSLFEPAEFLNPLVGEAFLDFKRPAELVAWKSISTMSAFEGFSQILGKHTFLLS